MLLSDVLVKNRRRILEEKLEERLPICLRSFLNAQAALARKYPTLIHL